MPPHSLDEVLAILSRSLRIRIALVLGPVTFLLIVLAGKHFSDGIDTAGPLGPLMEVAREKVLNRYFLVAIGAWASFWMLAVRLYFRKRRRLYGMYD